MQNQVIRNGVELKPSQLASIKRRFSLQLSIKMDEGKETQVEYKDATNGYVIVTTREKVKGLWFQIDQAMIGPKGKILG